HLLAALAEAFVFSSLVLTAPQALPEAAILLAVAVSRLDEHAVMLALDLRQRVAERREELVIRRNDVPVHLEFDDRLRLADRLDLAFEVGRLQFAGRDIGGDLQHLVWPAGASDDRAIGRLQPDFAPAFADPLEFCRLVLPTLQRLPELRIGSARP